MSGKIKLLIVDDHRIFRQGLRSLFQSEEQIEVVGEAANGAEAVEKASVLNPDVVLLDIMMPVMDGISAARRIRSLNLNIESVMLTMYRSETYQREAFAAGARGYLLKDCDFEEVVQAVKHASRGDYYLSGLSGKDLVAEYIQPLIRAKNSGGVITRREKETARLLADGYSTKETAKALCISPKTVETHRASLMKKLDARNVADIVKYCVRNHIIEP